MCHSSLRAAKPPRPSPRGCAEFNVNANLDSVFQSQFALLRMEFLQLVAVRIEEVARPLREEVATLKLLLAHVGVSLEPAKSCASRGLELAPASPLDSIEQKSSVVEVEHLYGCFFPRGSPSPSPQLDTSVASESEGIVGTMALQELCGDPPVVLPVELVSFEALAVATTTSPSQSESCQSHGGALAPSSEVLLAKEFAV